MEKARNSRSTDGRVFHHKVPTMDIAPQMLKDSGVLDCVVGFFKCK
jgi:hypothetical protein